MPLEFEVNGFDESGTIGRNLRFIRVGMAFSDRLRPFVYNILHFGMLTASKAALKGQTKDALGRYVRAVLQDQAISVDHYLFPCEHQLDVLRQFSLLEGKKLFFLRGQLIQAIQSGFPGSASEAAEYLRRYERSPFWMEAFVKAYGFRMVVADLANTSRVLSDPTIRDYRVFSYVDGGFPFVFWWNSFLSGQGSSSRFSWQSTPVFGITKGDEYYPVVNMAGSLASISAAQPSLVYPHNVKYVPEMTREELNMFYQEFSERVPRPSFHRRVIFYGDIPRDLQYSLPFILHSDDPNHVMYEPFRIEFDQRGSLRSFQRVFGVISPDRDIVVRGPQRGEHDRVLDQEFHEAGIPVRDASGYMDGFLRLCGDVANEARSSSLSQSQVNTVETSLARIIKIVRSALAQ